MKLQAKSFDMDVDFVKQRAAKTALANQGIYNGMLGLFEQIGGIDIKMAEDILREIGSISRALDSIANIEFKDLELNRGQYLYLTRVFEHPGIISDHLATSFFVIEPVHL